MGKEATIVAVDFSVDEDSVGSLTSRENTNGAEKPPPGRPRRSMKKVHPPRMGFATPAAARADHFSPACHVFVILLAQSLHHFVGGLASAECSQHRH